MKTDIYIKFILTVIAILLGTLVFKDSSFTISLPVGLWNAPMTLVEKAISKFRNRLVLQGTYSG